MDNEHSSNNLNQANSLALIDVIEEMTVDNDNLENFLQEEYDEEAYVNEVYIENINVEEQMDTNSNEDYYINSFGYFKYSETKTSDLCVNNTGNTFTSSLNKIKNNENSVSKELVNDTKYEASTSHGNNEIYKNYKRSLSNHEESSNSDNISDFIGNETDTDDLIHSITNSENNVLNNDLEYNTSHEMESPTNDQSLPNKYDSVSVIDSDDEDTSTEQLKPTLSIVGKEYLSKINYIQTPQNRTMFPGYNEKVFIELKNLISNKTLNDPVDTSMVYGISKVQDLLRVFLPNVWLNDLIIQQYINLLIKNCNSNNVLDFNTFFFEIVAQHGFNGYIKRYIKEINLLNYNKIIVPTHLDNNHWCLLVVEINKRKIIYFDSLGFFDIALEKMKVLAGFLNEEYLEKKLHLRKRKDLTWNIYIGKSPRQENSIDCGIFLCTNARYYILEEQINFNQGDIPLIRQRMSYELIHNTLLPTL